MTTTAPRCTNCCHYSFKRAECQHPTVTEKPLLPRATVPSWCPGFLPLSTTPL